MMMNSVMISNRLKESLPKIRGIVDTILTITLVMILNRNRCKSS